MIPAAAFALALAVAPAPAPGGALTESERESLWQDAIRWEVGSNALLVPAARRALVSDGLATLEALIPAKMDTKDTLVTRALNVIVTGIGEDAIPRLLPLLESESPAVRRNAADLLGALGAREAIPGLACLLHDEGARLGALAALGALGAREAVPDVAAIMASDAPERVRVTAAGTLAGLGGAPATAALVAALSDHAAPVRFAAQAALERARAVPELRRALGSPDLRVRLHALGALGHLAAAEARMDIARLLDDPSPEVRGTAVEAFASVATSADADRLRALAAGEVHPFVVTKLADAMARLAGVR